jgi:DNA polymerase III delta subunit
MTNIILKEQLVIDEDAREFILNISNNNAKILVNYMEKIKLLNKPINYQLVNTICSNISFSIFSSYTQCLLKKDIQTAIHILYSIYDRGYSVIDILDNYFIFVKTTNLFSEEQKYIIIPIICNYITFFYNIHENEIELALFSNNILSKL